MARPLIKFDDLLYAIRSGHTKVNIARIHPEDMDRVNMEVLQAHIRCDVFPSPEVERGMLFVESVAK